MKAYRGEPTPLKSAAEAMAERITRVLAHGFTLPIRVVCIDSHGDLVAGAYQVNAGGTCEWVGTIEHWETKGMSLPYYVVLVDALGQAAVETVTYGGKVADTPLQGEPGEFTGEMRGTLTYLP
jgi:hypothetical protein